MVSFHIMASWILFVILFLLLASAAYAAFRGAPWVPTWKRDLRRIEKLAQLKKGERFIELGCGTGRVCRYLAKHTEANTFGIELSFLQWIVARLLSYLSVQSRGSFPVILPARQSLDDGGSASEGSRNPRDSSLARLAQNDRQNNRASIRSTIFLGDVFNHDFSSYDVIYMFLMPETYKKLRDKLSSELQPGSRVISYVWPIPDWTPSFVDRTEGTPDIYLYIKK